MLNPVVVVAIAWIAFPFAWGLARLWRSAP
jgi:hypothetical protein